MDAVFALLLLLLGVSEGLKTFCDGRQDGVHCYGALGGTLVLKLMDSASETFKYRWLNKTVVILNGRKSRVVYNLMRNRSLFTHSNGVFRINNLSPADDGEYVLEVFDSRGYKLVHRNQQLTVQAPLSSVQLVYKCLSGGVMKVSCSSEGGDSPQYSWTLDRQKLMDSQLLSGNDRSSSITLKRDVSGLLVCTVRNHISTISACGGVYTNCTLPSGKFLSRWSVKATSKQCVQLKVSLKQINTEDLSLPQCVVTAAGVMLILIATVIGFVWRAKKLLIGPCSPITKTAENLNPSVLI